MRLLQVNEYGSVPKSSADQFDEEEPEAIVTLISSIVAKVVTAIDEYIIMRKASVSRAFPAISLVLIRANY
jgi:hypothetical protein